MAPLFRNLGALAKNWFTREAPVQVVLVDRGHTVWLQTVGLETLGVRELEIASCPPHLTGVARQVLTQIALNGAAMPESVRAGKTNGGRFVSSQQTLLEVFRLVPAVEGTLERLRVCDPDDASHSFPRQLIATNLCAAAEARPDEALRLLLVAVEIGPEASTASSAPAGDSSLNPNNFWGFAEAGAALVQGGQIGPAMDMWKKAACRWPRGAKLYGEAMCKAAREKAAPLVADQEILRFWSSLDDRQIRVWCEEARIKLPEAALT